MVNRITDEMLAAFRGVKKLDHVNADDWLRAALEAALAQGNGAVGGLDQAIAFVRKRCDDYVSEHGIYDPSTGVTEFPGNGDEIVCEWEEIIEGLEVLSDKNALPPSPVRACTCHPDDKPPIPCQQKFAYSECVSSAPTLAQDAASPPKALDIANLLERVCNAVEDYCSDMPDLAGHGHSVGLADSIRDAFSALAPAAGAGDAEDWDGLDCYCGGGWKVGHRVGCPEAERAEPDYERARRLYGPLSHDLLLEIIAEREAGIPFASPPSAPQPSEPNAKHWFAVQSPTGVHVGLWDDGKIAYGVAAEYGSEYTVMELVELPAALTAGKPDGIVSPPADRGGEWRPVELHIVFEDEGGPCTLRFIEVETPDGKSVRAGTWMKRKDGYDVLALSVHPSDVGPPGPTAGG